MNAAILSMWTVYARPRDYPEQFVARRSEVLREGGLRITDDVMLAPSLDAIRDQLAAHDPGLTRMARLPKDDPVIVEVWL